MATVPPDTPLLAQVPVAELAPHLSAAEPLDVPKWYGRLVRALARVYPVDHPVTLVNVIGGNGRRSHATLPLHRFGEFLPNIRENSHLFIDAVRPRQLQLSREV